MKILYLDCGMGAAGDMLGAALLALMPDPAGTVERLNALKLPGVTWTLEEKKLNGIAGLRLHVLVDGREEGAGGTAHARTAASGAEGAHTHDRNGEHKDKHIHEHKNEYVSEHTHEHSHHHGRTVPEITEILAASAMPVRIAREVRAVYDLIAEAESTVHGGTKDGVHFHELGQMDAVADITAASFLLRELKADRVIVSPVRTGYGRVHCAHGDLPVPAPATALLLTGIPSYAGDIEGELLTPTGAALLKHFADAFAQQPLMVAQKTGYGFGAKELPALNGVRAVLGETADGVTGEAAEVSGVPGASLEDAVEIACSLDDMTAEDIASAMQSLLAAGALDVWTSPAGMKKGRPGTVLNVLARPADETRLAERMLLETSSAGVRVTACRRYVLPRTVRTAETAYGPVRVKTVGEGRLQKEKPEYDDLAAIAARTGEPVRAVREKILREIAEKEKA